MGDVVHIDLARLKRGMPLPSQSDLLEQRIAALLARLDESPVVASEIIRLRNEIWLIDARDPEMTERARPPPALGPA